MPAACCPASFVLLPRDFADRKRQSARAGSILPVGRPVERPTQDRRDKLLEAFRRWLTEKGCSLDDICGVGPQYVAEANRHLVEYGRELFSAGWPYSHFSEVINAVSSKEPSLRRCFQPAWDVAFAWLREEPHTHHVALPWQALLAILSTALVWGWPRTAGCLALTWGALLRIGETLAATRSDLLLPGDVQDTCGFALLSIAEPKTRFKAARHQVARLDQPDLLKLVSLVFKDLPKEAKLWPSSPSTLRSRFASLVRALGMHQLDMPSGKQLDLGSLRAGGATWLLQTAEDSELVHRRGRWLNSRTMEIYIQEIGALTFLHRLNPRARRLVFGALGSFAAVVEWAETFLLSKVHSRLWYQLFYGGAA